MAHNPDFNERLLSDIVEESFEQGLSSDTAQSKFSTPKETTAYQLDLENLDSSKDEQQPPPPPQQNKATADPPSEETAAYNSLNKQYTKHCTEECTKQDCAHTIRYSESYERILKIISNYNSKLNKSKDADNLAEEDEEELDEEHDEEELDGEAGEEDEENEENEEESENEAYENDLRNEHNRDFQNEFRQLYSSTNQNIYRLNEFFKEELTKSLDPNLNNEQYIYRSLSETNLNYSLDYPPDHRHDSLQAPKNQPKLLNRTFSSDTVNNQLRSIERDLAISDLENLPVKGGVDGRNVKTFDEMLSRKLSGDYSNLPSILFRPENPTKRPYLRKGDGLKRFQYRSTSEPRGKLCRIRNQKLRQLKQQSVEKRALKKRPDNRKLPDPKRIDYLAQPKCLANRELGELDKENEMKLNQMMSKTPDHLNRDYMTSNLSDKFKDIDYIEKKSKSKPSLPSKEMKEKIKNKKQTPDNEQRLKKAKVQLVSKISVNKSQNFHEKRHASDLVVEKEWDKKVIVSQ